MVWLGRKTRGTPQVNGGGSTVATQKMERTAGQEAVHNPSAIHYFQVGTGFKLRLAMYMEEEMMGAAVHLTNAGRPFCLSYHLKCVCNSNCGGRHGHRCLLVRKRGLMAAWKYQFCGEVSPLVLKVDVGLLEATNISLRRQRTRGGH